VDMGILLCNKCVDKRQSSDVIFKRYNYYVGIGKDK